MDNSLESNSTKKPYLYVAPDGFEWMMWSLIFSYLLHEGWEIFGKGISGYFSEISNWFDATISVNFIIIFIFRIVWRECHPNYWEFNEIDVVEYEDCSNSSTG